MKNKEKKIEKKEENVKIKTKIDGKAIFTKIMAVFLLVLLILASSETWFYYVVESLYYILKMRRDIRYERNRKYIK